MSSLREKERSKELQEKFQAILSALLKDEDNKYCVDCDAKGPRWASWNLGLFLCIRCAGIHRNLGVHISRVKSVNLDSWTPEQIAMIQEIGNSRARAVYEANIPDGFRRPQGDSALEAFIRSKYEHKKYIAREWIPPHPKVPKESDKESWLEDSRAEKKRNRNKPAGGVQIPSIPKAAEKSSSSVEAPKQNPPVKAEVKVPAQPKPAPKAASNDLLGLDLGVSQQTNILQAAAPPTSGGNELLDLFGGPQTANAVSNPTGQTSAVSDLMNGGSSETNLFGNDSQTGGGGEEKKSAKDSILALYGSSGGGSGGVTQPQMYGVPGGVYMPQGQMYQQMPQGMPGQQQGMMAQQPNMMAQQQGMMGQQQQGMMGQQQGMMGQQPNMMQQQQPGMMPQQQGMMRPQQGMMGQQMMNGSQPNMFNGHQQMMGSNTQQQQQQQQQMYTPQQMQQLQFQQMQQQMTSMKLNNTQMGTQQAMPGAASSWGAPSSGHTLSNNLWQ